MLQDRRDPRRRGARHLALLCRGVRGADVPVVPRRR